MLIKSGFHPREAIIGTVIVAALLPAAAAAQRPNPINGLTHPNPINGLAKHRTSISY